MDPVLAAVVAEHFDLQIVSAAPVVGLGDECEIWRTVEPGGFAVRVSPRWRSAADLEWVYGVALVFAACVPGAQAPVLGVDGRSVAVWDGRPVSVWSWVPGAQLERESARARDRAAELLARLHECAEERFVAGSRPQPVDRCERCDHWPDLRDPELDALLDCWEADRSGRVPLHGDFYGSGVLGASGARHRGLKSIRSQVV